jgi:hypothetical protein
MTLSEYLKRDGALSLTDLSSRLDVSKGRLSQLRDALDWPPDLALRVEKETQGALDASALSPIIARARQAAA